MTVTVPNVPASADSHWRRPLWIVVVGGIVSVVLAVVTNIIAAYLQERFEILSEVGRLVFVIIVFLVSLGAAILIEVKHSRVGR
jgi:uncharacterized membrane protein